MSTFSMTITGPGIAHLSESRNLEDPNVPLTSSQLAGILTGANLRKLGSAITPENAVRIGTVQACLRIISSAIARMPLLVYRRVKGGSERAIDHPYYSMLSERPNLASTAFNLVQAMMMNCLGRGNGYAEIVRDRSGLVSSLHAVEAWRVRPKRLPGDTELTYEVWNPGGGPPVTLQAFEMLHVPGMSFDGLTGLSVIEQARRVLGLAEATTEIAGYTAAIGLRPGGFLEADGQISDPAKSKLEQDFKELHTGPQNAGKVIALPKGIKFVPPSNISPADAQLVESRKMSREDIAEIFGVPIHMLGGGTQGAGNNNVEASSLDFLNFTLAPWITVFQQELNYKLFNHEPGTYAEFLTQVMLLMDSKARGEFYGKLRDLGAINADEVRRRENLNTIPEDRGQVYFVPSNLMPAPTPEQGNELLSAWTKKTGGGQPAPTTDGKVGGSTNNA